MDRLGDVDHVELDITDESIRAEDLPLLQAGTVANAAWQWLWACLVFLALGGAGFAFRKHRAGELWLPRAVQPEELLSENLSTAGSPSAADRADTSVWTMAEPACAAINTPERAGSSPA